MTSCLVVAETISYELLLASVNLLTKSANPFIDPFLIGDFEHQKMLQGGIYICKIPILLESRIEHRRPWPFLYCMYHTAEREGY
jgi:hypothetical protein